MDNFSVDLSNCDKEPIHILGRVQSHGFLIAVDIVTGLVNYVSENIAHYLNLEPASLLGMNLEFLGATLNLSVSGSQFLFNQLIKAGPGNKNIESLNPYYVEVGGNPYHILLAVTANELIIECEVATRAAFEPQKIIGSSVSRILSGTTVDSLLHNAAREVKRIIKYDRVMVYQFGDDGHGKVVAEEKNDDLQPLLHFHYPASDIPRQARELYKINLTRIIANVHSEPSRIITSYADGRPLDLTHAELRAVSPIHIQYLKNMGVQSSFSISLVCKNELWGLIACHNYTPRYINFTTRSAARLIGQILSSAVEYRQHQENTIKFDLLNATSARLIDFVGESNQIAEALTKNSVTIKDITAAGGVALVFEKKITCLGVTPTEAQVREITQWLLANIQEPVFATHRFPKVYSPAEEFSSAASGILACILSRDLEEVIIWFKPEALENIEWAGNPEKPVEISAGGLATLGPRKSFESWTETVRHTSAPWSRAEITSVIKMREHIIYAIKRKANELRLLNEKLLLAYQELDSFSYTVSHDLRTPLSSIKGYSELLLNNASLDDNAKKILERIRRCTDKMAVLITEILNYSRVGQSKLEKQVVEMAKIIEDVRSELVESQNIDLDFIVGDTPDILGDAAMIKQVFSNLIGNAVKYSGKTRRSIVTVRGEAAKREVIYTISDNGIGIDVTYYNKVFELFRRIENGLDIEGSGVGLAIVKKIMEKHEGRVWFESELGSGTTFYIAFKNY